MFYWYRLIVFRNTLIKNNASCSSNTKRCTEDSRSIYYKYEYLGGNTPLCCATHLYNILKDVTKVLHRNNIMYFVNYGTFLGAVRHGGLIPWDTDIDLGITRNNRNMVYDILLEEVGKKYFVDNSHSEFLRVYLSEQNSLHLDFDIWDVEKEELVLNNDFVYGGVRVPKNEIYPLVKYKFYDLNLYGPRTLYFLEKVYGNDYMSVGYKKWGIKTKKIEIRKMPPAYIDVPSDTNSVLKTIGIL